MELTGVQKLARVLRVIVIIVFVCNIVALVLVPGFVLSRVFQVYPNAAAVASAFAANFSETRALLSDSAVWQQQLPYMVVLTLFLWLAGVCTALILWQAKRVLDTIVKGETFTLGNAANLKRAAVCCFVISGAALARTVWRICYYRSIAPLLTYNFLFVPLFLLAGLVCMVMSALFRQAAELKAEQKLTI